MKCTSIMNNMLFRLIICCTSLYIIVSRVVTSGSIQHNPTMNGRKVEKSSNRDNGFDTILQKLILIRGGKEPIKLKKKESEVNSSKNMISFIKAEFVSLLKRLIPRSYWPKTWKTGSNKSVSSKSMSKEHLEKSFAKGDSSSRIQKELRSFMSNPPENCKLAVGSNIRSWLISIKGADNTIYAGENFKLKIVFPKEYPSKPPSVYFLKPTPKHVHVYSNGDICLNLLGRDWRPTMTAQTLVLSILSMLASAKEKKMPQDNAMHADAAPGQQQDNWMYHDDRC